MKYIQITDRLVSEVLSSFTANDVIKNCVDNIIKSMSSSYSDFVYSVLTRHSVNYVKLDSPNCPLNPHEARLLLERINQVPVPVKSRDILIADKMDLLYGTDMRSFAEFTKFTPSFYGSIEEEIFELDTMGSNDIFTDSIREVERLISYIEQLIIVSSQDEILEDLVVLGLGHKVGVLYILVH